MNTASRGEQQKILVVDDDDLFRLALAKALQRRGFQIAEADSGEAALGILQLPDQNVDLVLADVVMPGMSGFMLAGHAARLDGNLKTLFISGYPFITLARDYGMPGDLSPLFLPKPFGVEALTAKVSEVLAL